MPRQIEIQKLIKRHQRRLQKLKEKQAMSGANTSPEILTEIEDIETEIEHLQEELRKIDTDTQESSTGYEIFHSVNWPVTIPLIAIVVGIIIIISLFYLRVVLHSE